MVNEIPRRFPRLGIVPRLSGLGSGESQYGDVHAATFAGPTQLPVSNSTIEQWRCGTFYPAGRDVLEVMPRVFIADANDCLVVQ